MGTIFYSMAGEGRGHATRVRTVVESLRGEHRFVLFAPGAAYDFLYDLYGRDASGDVSLKRIPGLMFAYRKQRLNMPRTLFGAGKYLTGLPRLLAWLKSQIDVESPDLVISDFEPALPRAARACGIPYLSLDHQHFLRAYDLSGLPPRLQWHARTMAPVVGAYCSGQKQSIISSFYFPPLKPAWKDALQIGVLLRPEIQNARTTRDGHLCVYLRRFVDPHVLDAFGKLPCPVRVYGVGERKRSGNLSFHAINNRAFVRDLASSEALISTAGNQLLGEAISLGKPCFVMPEPKNREQDINAHFLARSEAGDWCRMQDVSEERLRSFIDQLPDFRSRIDADLRDRMNGTPEAVAAIRRHMPSTVHPSRRLTIVA